MLSKYCSYVYVQLVHNLNIRLRYDIESIPSKRISFAIFTLSWNIEILFNPR